ncbi:MAG: AI-2E family transporter [Oscillospiraceae bacterium]
MEMGQPEKGSESDREKNIKMVKRQLITAGIVIFSACCIILFYFSVQRYNGLHEAWSTFMEILQPIIIGAGMAFLINPILQFLERRIRPFIEKHSRSAESAKKLSRWICALLALIIFLGLIALVFVAIIPEIYGTIRFLIENLGNQIGKVLDWANDITGGYFADDISRIKASDLEETFQGALELLGNFLDMGQRELVSVITSGAIGAGRFVVNLVIGIIVSVYILIGKERFKGQVKKMVYGVFGTDQANVILEICRKAATIFYGYIIGTIIDSFMVGVVCYIAMRILQLPYAMLVSTIVGITNVIPVFGPYIGAVPSVIIIFLTNPMQGIYFLIMILVLQQVDGNIIAPKILGNSTGLSSFWVVVAIVVGGGLFGFFGMLLGVPTMALIYYLIGRFSKYLLRKKDLPEETDVYVHLKEVDLKTNEVVRKTVEEEERGYFFFPSKGSGKKKKKGSEEEENKEP